MNRRLPRRLIDALDDYHAPRFEEVNAWLDRVGEPLAISSSTTRALEHVGEYIVAHVLSTDDSGEHVLDPGGRSVALTPIKLSAPPDWWPWEEVDR